MNSKKISKKKMWIIIGFVQGTILLMLLLYLSGYL